MYASMWLHGDNMYTPAGFVNISSSIGRDLSLISFAYIYIYIPVRVLNVVLSPPINYILIGGESFPRLPPAPSHSELSQ